MLLTPRLFVHNQDASNSDVAPEKRTLQGGFPALPAVCVVPRGMCSFRRIRLVGTGRNAQKAAALKASKEALPGENGTYIAPDVGEVVRAATPTDMAGVWNFAKSEAHQGRYMPESLAQVPHDNGARLVHGLSGYEGQIWIDKNLVASRWWLNPPSANSWDVFMRAAQDGLGAMDYPLPVASAVPWRRDIAPFTLDPDQLAYWFSPRNLGAAVGTVLACGFLFMGAGYLRNSLALSKTNAAMEGLSTETQLILSQQRRAMANLRYAQNYDALGRNDTVLMGLSALATVLGETDLSIERFDIRLGQIDARLRGETEISVPDVVSLLEADPGLSSVSVTLDAQGAVLITADLGDGMTSFEGGGL
ncbi:hypothetical protein [Fretibacter rubidus]|uniref:hypothetical protein n=1 Tax=Fretibacter rubidus TaxID=570162 RepID=UPI00352A40E1